MAVVTLLIAVSACRSTTVPQLSVTELEEVREHLNRPLPGDPMALYRLRVPRSGGLRLSLQTSGEEGRITVSEPFGSAVSITAWTGSGPPTFFDLREGCLLEDADLSRIVGIDALPMPQAVRLLVGRLPTLDGDVVLIREDGRLQVEGRGWSALVTVAAQPSRVVLVEQQGAGKSGWRLRLDDHTSSVPGHILVDKKGGPRAEMELVNLEWKDGGVLASLPELPSCTISQR